MNRAISIPGPLTRQADELARRLHKTLNQLVAEALAEYIAHHDPSTITERLNAVYDAIPETEDPFVAETGRSILRQVEW
jgi:hypothetical protein